MPVRLADQVAMLCGTVTVEEVEPLAEWVRAHPASPVILHNCEHLHTAVLQLFLVHGTKISRPPRDPFLASWVMPLLGQSENPGEDEAQDDCTQQEAEPIEPVAQETVVQETVIEEMVVQEVVQEVVQGENGSVAVGVGVTYSVEHADSADKPDETGEPGPEAATLVAGDSGAESSAKEVM
ncbi:hypothetical protein Kisp01_41590 [Kineosporia sp. NBRC 101677]|uniref:hypothetical protein n=1 Tax=Kineosporia sp. NBRC 101677 TaxID=3032197 RepID=UPI0024A09C04|nr:hypothetical protein [Kineosporia sp. NBRC 101677]GLY17144.1 hypothetical protein Kisp01_41590 [Kineosporia sp. NBRC 101677]